MDSSRVSVRAAFIAVTTLFFAWGFITSLLDPLVAAVKGIFVLSDTEAQLSAFAFFIAYGVVSFPAAVLIARVRAVPSILLALAMMALACIVMLLAANMAIYAIVLAGLFILASGITILQVAANPLAAALGPPERSHFRLTLSQTFNSFGTFIGPWLGASLFLAGVEVSDGAALDSQVRTGALAGIDRAYFWICGLILLLLAFFWFNRRTVSAAAPPPPPAQGIGAMISEAVSSRWTLLGGGAIFLYVGAEVAIGTQMALFLNSPAVWANSDAAFSVPFLGWVMNSDGVPGVSLEEAGRAVAFYWGGAMVGRAVGSLLLTRFRAAMLLALFVLLRDLGVINTYLALILPYTSWPLALTIYLLRSFYLTLPGELEDAARIDGCGELMILPRIVLPLVRPALGATGILLFLNSWNSFIWPLIMTRTNQMATLPLGLASLNSLHYVEYGMLMAGALLSVIPMLVLFVLLHRQFVEGLTHVGDAEDGMVRDLVDDGDRDLLDDLLAALAHA